MRRISFGARADRAYNKSMRVYDEHVTRQARRYARSGDDKEQFVGISAGRSRWNALEALERERRSLAGLAPDVQLERLEELRKEFNQL